MSHCREVSGSAPAAGCGGLGGCAGLTGAAKTGAIRLCTDRAAPTDATPDVARNRAANPASLERARIAPAFG